jgi:hypothetical protein
MPTRPKVTVSVVDNSFVVAGSEAQGAHISGMVSLTNPSLVELFGVTADKQVDYMTVETIGDWVAKLNGTTFGGVTGSGPTGSWATDWYSAYNYLTYGGVLKIAETTNVFYDAGIALDSMFTAQATSTHYTAVSNITSYRDDIIGIVGVTYDGYTGGSTVPTTPTVYPTLTNADNKIFAVGGEKVMLGISNNGSTNYVTIPLAGDAAGCFVRTDRDSQRWFSPAGTRRGRILNTIRLIKNPTAIEQDNLYNNKINSIIGIAGDGVYLFGDITQEGTTTSTLTRVNVVRLINYIKKVLGKTANGVLFEVNDATTRSLFANAATGFLQNIKDGRGLYDFKVVCDESNNPAAILDSNQFVADIYIKPTKSINYVKVTITNLNTDAQL